MAEGPYLLGIDFGTGGVRVGIFDSDGKPVVFTERDFALNHPRPGWAEQDPDEWWDRLVGSGLRFSEAREQMPGVTLEGAAAIEVIGGCAPEAHGAWDRRRR